jgi:hypothetical protein
MGGGGGVRVGRKWRKGTRPPYQVRGEEGGGGEGVRGNANSHACPVSNYIHVICSFPHSPFFLYLRSAEEASLNIKKAYMEPNTGELFFVFKGTVA